MVYNNKMKHKKVAILAMAMLMLVCNGTQAQTTLADSIQQAVLKHLEAYPQATLQDVYKNFFQDQLGPGHIIEDTSRAGLMLREELKQHHSSTTTYYEAIGYRNNFYRVNLSVVWNGIISYQQLFEAFVASAIPLTQSHIDHWKQQWQYIETVIENMNLNIENYNADKEKINTILNEGKYMMRHSKNYNQLYNPHYRLIEKHIFEQQLLPIINQYNKTNHRP